jgi:predicted MFS family arabinose efflux permease
VKEGHPRLSHALLWVMAFASAATVANLWYNQPLLGAMADTFHRAPAVLGRIATLTQAGYALGLLLFVPLGDLVERRRLLWILTVAVMGALMLESAAPSLFWLELSATLVGLSTPIPQIILPLVADLAAPAERGRAVGLVMGGLLIGILAARTVAGFIANWLGWRMVFRFAALLMLVIAGVIRWQFPVSRPRPTRLSYGRTLASLWPLVRSEPELAAASLTGAALFATFSGFWTALTFLLRAAPFHFSPEVIGLFGLVGIGGASAAPLAGRLADQGHPRRTVTVALCGASLSMLWLLWAPRSVFAIIVGIVLLDVSTQSGQISNQSRIYALSQTARSRLNTVYMVSYFVGGALGSGAVSVAWGWWRWPGVTLVGLGFLVLGGLAHYWGYQRAKPPTPAGAVDQLQ